MGGGSATGGGSGGGNVGGGAGGGSASVDAGVDAGILLPLVWSSRGISGATSTGNMVAVAGSSNDLWAVQDNGDLFHSDGGVFTRQFTFPGGANGLFAAGGTVALIQNRHIRTCTSGCTAEADFANVELLNSPLNLNLFGTAICGLSATKIAAVVSNTTEDAQLFEWDGVAWARTNTNLGLRYPMSCWFDESGRLFIGGQDKVAVYEGGGSTPVPLSTNGTYYYGGANVEGTPWLVGSYDSVWHLPGAAWEPLSQMGSNTMRAVGGLRGDEVFALGMYSSTNGNGFKWNGTQLRPAGQLLPGFGTQSMVRSLARTGPNELYVAGGDSAGPLIVRGRR